VTEALHPNVRRVIEAGAALGLAIEPRRFPDGTKTAADAAAAVGCWVAASQGVVIDLKTD
jgi:hypothetical protein